MAAIGGEWFIGSGDGYPADAAVKRFVYANQPNGERYIVAKVWADEGDYESTARLVAAAPELLAALKQCLPIIDSHRRAFLGDGDVTAAYARLVIAQAEGRTDEQGSTT